MDIKMVSNISFQRSCKSIFARVNIYVKRILRRMDGLKQMCFHLFLDFTKMSTESVGHFARHRQTLDISNSHFSSGSILWIEHLYLMFILICIYKTTSEMECYFIHIHHFLEFPCASYLWLVVACYMKDFFNSMSIVRSVNNFSQPLTRIWDNSLIKIHCVT